MKKMFSNVLNVVIGGALSFLLGMVVAPLLNIPVIAGGILAGIAGVLSFSGITAGLHFRDKSLGTAENVSIKSLEEDKQLQQDLEQDKIKELEKEQEEKNEAYNNKIKQLEQELEEQKEKVRKLEQELATLKVNVNETQQPQTDKLTKEEIDKIKNDDLGMEKIKLK